MVKYKKSGRLDELAGYVSLHKAGDLLQVSEHSVRALIGRGELEATNWNGSSPMITRASIDVVLASRGPEWEKPGPRYVTGGRPAKKSEAG